MLTKIQKKQTNTFFLTSYEDATLDITQRLVIFNQFGKLVFDSDLVWISSKHDDDIDVEDVEKALTLSIKQPKPEIVFVQHDSLMIEDKNFYINEIRSANDYTTMLYYESKEIIMNYGSIETTIRIEKDPQTKTVNLKHGQINFLTINTLQNITCDIAEQTIEQMDKNQNVKANLNDIFPITIKNPFYFENSISIFSKDMTISNAETTLNWVPAMKWEPKTKKWELGINIKCGLSLRKLKLRKELIEGYEDETFPLNDTWKGEILDLMNPTQQFTCLGPAGCVGLMTSISKLIARHPSLAIDNKQNICDVFEPKFIELYTKLDVYFDGEIAKCLAKNGIQLDITTKNRFDRPIKDIEYIAIRNMGDDKEYSEIKIFNKEFLLGRNDEKIPIHHIFYAFNQKQPDVSSENTEEAPINNDHIKRQPWNPSPNPNTKRQPPKGGNISATRPPKTLKDLRKEAAALFIPGRSKMNRDELLETILFCNRIWAAAA